MGEVWVAAAGTVSNETTAGTWHPGGSASVSGLLYPSTILLLPHAAHHPTHGINLP